MGEAHRLELVTGRQFKPLALRPVENEAWNFFQGAARHGERLKKATVLAPRFKAGFAELRGDMVGRLVDALGGNAPPFALVGGKEGQVLAHPAFGIFCCCPEMQSQDKQQGR